MSGKRYCSGRSGRALVAMGLLCSLFVTGGCRQHHRPVLTLSVAASLQDALIEVESAYQREHGTLDFRNNFGSSGTLAREIEEGAPVDAFLSAGEKPMNQLEAGGLLQPGTRANLLRNELVLIAPTNSSLQGFEQLTGDGVKLIALGDPASVPAGQYGRETLESLHLYEAVKSRLVLGKDVRQVLTYVETGNADAGLVYATDARLSNRVRVVAAAPANSHRPIVYPMAEIKGSQNDAAVRSFFAFLESQAAQAIFRKYGFQTE